MELSKQDNQMAKGIAIVGMVMLHLFCRLEDLPYEPMIWIGSTPLIYYLGLFGDLCVPVYCFCSGYAQMLMVETKKNTPYRLKKLFRFLVNFWVVVIVFAIIGLIFDKSNSIPGSWRQFAGNIFLYRLTYNGAWWFVNTYIFLVLATPVLAFLARKIKMIPLIILSGCVYSVSYIFSSKISIEISNPFLSWVWRQSLLFGTSQFSFIVGMTFYYNHVISNLRRYFNNKILLKNVICATTALLMFLGHGWIQTVAVAPITGICTITCFYLWNKPHIVQNILLFLGKHSTNIWLVHMFFYLVLFKGLVFHAKYPVLIFAFMMVLCIASSYAIQYIENIIYKVYPKFPVKI